MEFSTEDYKKKAYKIDLEKEIKCGSVAELGLMRGIANPIYSFRVSRVRIPPLPPTKIIGWC